MADFSKKMLIEGIEEILVNPKFETGVGIVSTIKELINRGIVANEGKVKTIISERSVEEATEVEVGAVAASAEAEMPTTTEVSEQQLQQPPASAAAKVPVDRPPISAFSEVIALAKKLDAKMQEGPQQFLPQLMALMTAIDNGVDLVDQLNRPLAEVAGVQVSDQTAAIMQRIDRLPKRYLDILLQLLGNWEKQSK